MIERLKALFAGFAAGGQTGARPLDELQLATAALLVEAAVMDGTFDVAEEAAIARALTRQFGLAATDVATLIEDARRAVEENTQLYAFTHVIKDHFAPEDRVKVIEMLWEVAYADGTLDDYEASLVRRVSGLIYVPDHASGEARKRVLARLGLSEKG